MKRTANITFVLIVAATSAATAQRSELPSDPLAGRLVFEGKGCLRCHALGGFGGTEGPDLAQERFFGSAADLASVIWNHIPEMNRTYRRLGLSRPSLSEPEMLQLMGFLYYLRYLGEPGSALRGKELLEEKGCNTCHGDIRGKASQAPAFRHIERDVSPVNLVQAMWNHGPSMQEEVATRGMKYPALGPDDVGDISAYLQLAAEGSARIRMSPGNPKEGGNVFNDKHCTSCHSVDGGRDKEGLNFKARDLKRSVTQIAGLMWNHAPIMYRHMQEADVEWPLFRDNEMADLVAYLYFLGFEGEAADTAVGGVVFEETGCINCHKSGATGPAPDLAELDRPSSVIGLAARMWDHASEMEDQVLSRNLAWPQIDGTDMQNLFGYLHAHMKAGH